MSRRSNNPATVQSKSTVIPAKAGISDEKKSFNAQRLLELYDRVADAPDAVERLRKFVLDLAVRGKLVEQDEGDELAGELLHRIEVEKAELIKKGEIRKWKVPARIGQSEQSFDLPKNWAWVRFGTIGLVGSSRRVHQKDWKNQGVPFYRAREIVRLARDGAVDNDLFISEQLYEELAGKGLCPEPNDLMITGVGTIGVAYAVSLDDRFYFKDASVLIFKNIFNLPSDYLKLFCSSPYWFKTIHESSMGTTVHTLTIARANAIAVPLPPLPEQHRIVAKVNELMALLDRLETTRTQREATRNRLTTASLTILTSPETTKVDFPTHARFALDNLDQLTRRPEQINALRQTLLNLAVRGRLVEQDPADEPASELLSRVAAEVNNSGSGHGRKSKRLRDVDIADAPFELPPGWTWAHFPELGQFGRGKSRHRPRNDPALYTGGSHLMIQTGDVARSEGRITTYTNKYNDVGLAQSLLWPKGTLCITIAANIADSGILDFDACFPDSVVGFVPDAVLENARYFEYFVRTAKANLLEYAPATAQRNINLEILKSVLIPLPPLVEQRRIVAKVDSLLALCDRLQTVKAQIGTTRSQLLQALLRDALEMERSICGLVTEVSQRPVGAL